MVPGKSDHERVALFTRLKIHLAKLGKLVSIIMPCHNSSVFIMEAIQSIVDQTYTNWELLVMDDHSTDNTVSLVRGMQEEDGRIVLHTSEENYGVARQMNKGIARARGEYIARMDSDDRSAPERIIQQLSYLEKFPGICLCTTDYKVFRSSGAGEEQKGQTQDPAEAQTRHYPEGAGPMRVGLLGDLPVCESFLFRQKGNIRNLFL